MTVCLLVAAILILLNAGAVAVAWRFLAKRAARPRLARQAGALLGAAGGAWAAMEELVYLTDRVCSYFQRDTMCNASLPVPALYLFPLALPLTTGLYAWLCAEIIGGRTHKPLFAVGWTFAGALLASAAVFLPLVLAPGFWEVIPSAMREPIMITLPGIGALLALALAHRAVRFRDEHKSQVE